MKNYLAVYLGSEASMAAWKALSDGEREQRQQAGMQAWGAWVATNAGAIVAQGSPLGKTKRISPQGITDVRNEMAAYTVVQAESHEAAAAIFKNHPHFAIFPGDAVEIMECLPIPGA